MITIRLSGDAVNHLAESDGRLGALMQLAGDYRLATHDEPYAALARAIVGQQVSSKAAQTIWKRLVSTTNGVSPEKVLSLDQDQLRAVGLSRSKVGYLRELARRALAGDLDLNELQSLEDGAVLKRLTAMHGVGNWTAEMFLIFCLAREDVVSLSDLGLRRAAAWLHGSEDLPPAELARLSERWRPYRSIASLYLWRALDSGFVNGSEARELLKLPDEFS